MRVMSEINALPPAGIGRRAPSDVSVCAVLQRRVQLSICTSLVETGQRVRDARYPAWRLHGLGPRPTNFDRDQGKKHGSIYSANWNSSKEQERTMVNRTAQLCRLIDKNARGCCGCGPEEASMTSCDSGTRHMRCMPHPKNGSGPFQAAIEKLARDVRSRLERTKAQLESQWNGFEAQVKTYIETVGKQIEQQQGDVPRSRRCASWRLGARQPIDSTTQRQNSAAERRADFDAAVEQMKADASEAEARSQKLKQAEESPGRR